MATRWSPEEGTHARKHARRHAHTHYTHTHIDSDTHLAYGGVGVTGGRMPAALALNTAAHSGGGGRPGRWSRCQGAGTEAVKTCSALLVTQGDTHAGE